MAILDERLELADASTAVAAAASTVNVGDVIDSSVARDVGNGQPIYLVVSVDTEIITGGSAGTLQFQLVSDGVTTPSTTTQTIHAISEEYVTDGTDANDAELKAGQFPFVIALPVEGQQYERYIGLQAIIGTTTITAGAVSAYLTLTPPTTRKTYADAVN